MDHALEPLVLKVMRLRRPGVHAPAAFPGFGALEALELPLLMLPTALTQSLVGEHFKGYLHLANQSPSAILGVVLKVEVQVGAAKHVLFDNSDSPVDGIQPGRFFDVDVEHQLRDAGTYVLTCNVSYTPAGGFSEPGIFKRSYRFPAMHPFVVTHQVVQADAQLLVECTVENATSGSICLTSWQFECAGGLRATPLDDGGQTGGRQARYLKPTGSHSFVFRVAPADGASGGDSLSRIDAVGSLALGWHVPDGPSGSTAGQQVRLRPCVGSALGLRVVDIPRQVRVERPFKLEVEVANHGASPVEPHIVFDTRLMGHVRVSGATQRPVGRIEPQASVSVPLELLAAVPGMHGLQGISVVDEHSKVRGEFGVLCDIVAF